MKATIMKRLALAVLLTTFAHIAGARADILLLNDKGVAALKASGFAAPSADGRGYVAQGQFIVPRNAADLPTPPEPAAYFLFRPLQQSFHSEGAKPSWQNSTPQKWEWAWVKGVTHHHFDALDDVRDMLSNRDKRFGGWEESTEALLADLDSSGALGLKTAAPAPQNKSVVPREGWLSRYLVVGPMTPQERIEMVTRARSRPKEDPLGYSPLDPLLWMVTPESTVSGLVEGIARCAKYGEPEPGLTEACRHAAAFICNALYVPREKAEAKAGSSNSNSVPPVVIPPLALPFAQPVIPGLPKIPAPLGGPAPANTLAEKAMRIRAFHLQARAALFNHLDAASPQAIAIALAQSTSAVADPLRTTMPDDALPLDFMDMAQAALQVTESLAVAREEDQAQLVNALLGLAGGRSDFRGTGAKTPAEVKPLDAKLLQREDELGKQAFQVLVHLAAAQPPDKDDVAGGFRAELLNAISAAIGEEARTSEATAARESLVLCGIGSAAEIKPLVEGLVSIGYRSDDAQDWHRDDAVYILKRLPQHVPDEKLRNVLQNAIADQLQELKERQKLGTGGRGEKYFLRQWSNP
jgi:hypothetical protein